MATLIKVSVGEASVGLQLENVGKVVGGLFRLGRKTVHSTANVVAKKTAPRKRTRK